MPKKTTPQEQAMSWDWRQTLQSLPVDDESRFRARLHIMAEKAHRLVDAIRQYFPVRSRPWKHKDSKGHLEYREFFWAQIQFEANLNPERLAFVHPGRQDIFAPLCGCLFPDGEFKFLQAPDPWPALLLAAKDLVKAYDEVLTHYRLERVALPPLEAMSWTWPNIPPISAKRLHRLDRVATVLECVLAGRRPPAEKHKRTLNNRKSIGKGRPKRATVNMRMMETIQVNPEAMGWTSTQWQKHLKCRSRSVITDTQIWKSLEINRLRLKAERGESKRRRPRHYGKD